MACDIEVEGRSTGPIWMATLQQRISIHNKIIRNAFHKMTGESETIKERLGTINEWTDWMKLWPGWINGWNRAKKKNAGWLAG